MNAAIAYNVWQYYNVGDDIQFLKSYGAEILFRSRAFYTGLEFRGGMLSLNPKIPDDLPALSMKIQYGGNWFDFSLTRERMTVHCDRYELDAARISFRADVQQLQPGERLTFTVCVKSLGGDAK